MKNFYIFILIYISAFVILNAEDLRWAADAEGNAPYIFQDPRIPTNNIGFEIDIVNAIAAELKLNPVFVQNQWDGLIPGLYRGDYQIAMNGIEITEDRLQTVNFSIPYLITSLQLIVRADNESIASISDLKNIKSGALSNSLAERVLKENKDFEVLTYDGELKAFEDLKNRRIDAVLVDAPIALYYVSWNQDLKMVGTPIGEAKYGIALKKEDTLLKNKLDTAINRIIANGKLREILEKWNLWNYQMALYTNDNTPTELKPEKYNYFVESQIRDITLEELYVRYLSFVPMVGRAALMTVQISVLSMILAIVLGLVIAVIRVYAPVPLSSMAVIYIEVIRGTPLLIQLFFIFYALPSIGISLSPFVAAILSLGLNYAAYEAENYRAGLYSVPRGQMEAALALGLNRRQSLRYIILPQAFRLVIPPVTNDFISLLKDSSLVSVITLVELTKLYNQLSSTYFDYIGTGILIALVYLLLGLPFVNLSKFFERKLSLDKKNVK